MQGATFTINDVDWNSRTMVLDSVGATFRQVEVQMGDSELKDLDRLTGEFFNAGEFAWWNEEWTDGISRYPWQLVAIRATTTTSSNVVDIFKGHTHVVANHRLAPAWERNEDKAAYAQFLTAVADPDLYIDSWENHLPANALLFSVNWGLSAANHRSPCKPPPEATDVVPGETVTYKARDPTDRIRFNDNLREASAPEWGEEGQETYPKVTVNNGAIYMALGAAGVVTAAYFL